MAKVHTAGLTVRSAPKRAAEDPFHNGRPDDLSLKDGTLKQLLHELHADGATFVESMRHLASKVAILGTARSKPQAGENGFKDYEWGEKLGVLLRKAGFSIGTGGGDGAMEAPLRGHALAQAFLEMRAHGRAQLGWETEVPQREAANIALPNEQRANQYIDHGRLSTYQHFLFRMEFLFRNTRDFVATPGGFGTVAEIFTFLAMKDMKQVNDPVLFGAPDKFFHVLNAAFTKLLGENAPADLKDVHTDPNKLVESLKRAGTDGMVDDIPKLAARMIDALEEGLNRLDGAWPAVAFVGGSGAHSKASLGAMTEIASALAKGGETLRLGGSAVIDSAVTAAAQSAKPGTDIQSFALKTSTVDGPQVTKVDDLLVLRELLSTNLKGLVITVDAPEQVALLFNLAVDIQTGKLPKIPIVVLDPDGTFDALKKTLGETMLSGTRQYINREDLDLFQVTNDPTKALEILNAPPTFKR